MDDSVAIAGGGIGGLAAAHHLVRGGARNITVYEASEEVGGKARSQYRRTPLHGSYPGEHGFRFFPHFYRHLLETLRQIEVGGETVYDRLVGPRTAAIAYRGTRLIVVPRPVRIEPSASFVRTTVDILQRHEVSLPDAVVFAGRLLTFASSCHERREHELDKIAWTKFTGAEDDLYSPEFRDVAILASQNLSAMRADRSSAATIGAITLQLLFTFAEREKPDALLAGPTDEMWLRDWRAYLESLGVRFEFGKRLTALEFDERAGRIVGLGFGAERVEADHYVCAIPLECMVQLLDDRLKAFDRSLAMLPELAAEALGDMTGIQFFLRRPVPITNGHIHYPGTPFALTSVSQGQFWRCPPAEREGTPELGDVLSVILSDWDELDASGRPAKAYGDPEELAREVWRQMKSALPPGTLDDDDVLDVHVDSNVSLGPFRNQSPLLVHPLDQLRRRPRAQTGIENLYLASDYVRTHTDLATMEGADEAARQAARAILCNMGVGREDWPDVVPLDEGPIFAFAKTLDAILFKAGVRHPMMEPRARSVERALLRFRTVPGRPKDADVGRVNDRLKRLALPQITTDLRVLEQWERVLRGQD